MVAQRGEELADTRGALSAIDAHVRSQAETIGVLTTGMQALPSYGERVSALQDNINGLQQRLTGIEAAFGPLGQRLGSIETAVSRPDSAVSERLAALEGMIGPMSQRLGQSLTEHNASLQALHGRVEALAAGTQAGLDSLASGAQAAIATSGSLDEGAAVVLEPRLASLASELASLRSEVSALAAASPTAALAELRDQITALAKARPASAAASSKAAASGDVDAAVAAAESRIKDHVDDAIVALAQTLLGKARADGVRRTPLRRRRTTSTTKTTTTTSTARRTVTSLLFGKATPPSRPARRPHLSRRRRPSWRGVLRPPSRARPPMTSRCSVSRPLHCGSRSTRMPSGTPTAGPTASRTTGPMPRKAVVAGSPGR
jgi:hypothetical protein